MNLHNYNCKLQTLFALRLFNMLIMFFFSQQFFHTFHNLFINYFYNSISDNNFLLQRRSISNIEEKKTFQVLDNLCVYNTNRRLHSALWNDWFCLSCTVVCWAVKRACFNHATPRHKQSLWRKYHIWINIDRGRAET